MSDQPDRMELGEFRASRRRKTDNLLKEDHRDLKRFFALDSAAYRDASTEGGLDEKTKELLGLVASTVLRCNDCIAYHCDQCVKVGWRKAELLDALNVALVVGGSITIPHIRTVWEVVEQLYGEQEAERRAKEGTPGLQRAAAEVQTNVAESRNPAVLTVGRKATAPAPAATVAAASASLGGFLASQGNVAAPADAKGEAKTPAKGPGKGVSKGPAKAPGKPPAKPRASG